MTRRQRSISRHSRRASSHPPRRGGATLELAVVLPLVLLIFFGTVDALAMMFVKQSLSLAAYEASRMAAGGNVTSNDVKAACEKLLAERGVHNATVRTIPEDFNDVQPGEMIQVEVQVDFSDADLYFARLHQGRLAKLSFSAMKRGAKEDLSLSGIGNATPESIDTSLAEEINLDVPDETSILR